MTRGSRTVNVKVDTEWKVIRQITANRNVCASDTRQEKDCVHRIWSIHECPYQSMSVHGHRLFHTGYHY